MKTYLFSTAREQNMPISYEKRALTPTLSTDDLPESYWDLLSEQNGGYVRNMIVPTAEPTSDGLDHAYLHYIFGLHDEETLAIPYQDFLPDYFVIFSAHGQRYFVFDYSNADLEPTVRYLDTETDNWQLVAQNFSAFRSCLQPGEEDFPPTGHLTQTEADHAFLMVENPARLDALWHHLEDVPDKSWYFEWIKHFAKQPTFHLSAFAALQTQVMYFRLQLPENAPEIFSLFPEKQEWIKKELVD